MNNLTPGHEEEEYNLYAKEFAGYFVLYLYADPGMKDIFFRYWEKGKAYGKPAIRVNLAVSYVLGITRIGRIVKPILVRLKYPGFIARDVRRVKDCILKGVRKAV